MRCLWWLMLLLWVVGCGGNLLPAYAPSVERVAVVWRAEGGPRVVIGEPGVAGGGRALGSVAALGGTVGLLARLELLIAGERLAEVMGEATAVAVWESLGWVWSSEAEADGQLSLVVSDFGFEARDLSSAGYFYVEGALWMTTSSEARLIWTSSATVREAVRSVQVTDAGGFALVGGVLNVAGLQELDDAQLLAVFDALSYQVGLALVAQMVADLR